MIHQDKTWPPGARAYFPCIPIWKNLQALMIRQKIWPLGGRAYFPYISIIENFKNVLVIDQWTDFYITWQVNVSLVTLYQDCSCPHDSSKNLAARGGAYFPYISI